MTQDPAQTSRQRRAFDLDIDLFKKAARSNGWVTDGEPDHDKIAAALGLSKEQVGRVLDRKSRPGVAFIAGLLNAAEDVRFRPLFPNVDAADPIGKE